MLDYLLPAYMIIDLSIASLYNYCAMFGVHYLYYDNPNFLG